MNVSRNTPRLVSHSITLNGEFNTSAVVKGRRKGNTNITQGQVTLESSYTGPLPLSNPKYKDLQVLKNFVSNEHHDFYTSLAHDSIVPDDEPTVGTLMDD